MLAHYYGFELMARIGVIGAFGHIALTLVMIPGVARDLDVWNLWPINEFGWRPLLSAASVGLADFMMPVGLAVTFLPFVKARSSLARTNFLAVLGSGLVILLWPLAEIMVLGPALTAQQAVSCGTLARAASLGIYIHRYELIMLILFLPGVFLVTFLPFYGATGGIARALGLGNRRAVVVPLAVVLVTFSTWLLKDRLRTNDFFSFVWPPAVLLLGSLLVAFAVLAGWLARKEHTS